MLGRSIGSVSRRFWTWKAYHISVNPNVALRTNVTPADAELLLQLRTSGTSWPKIQSALPDQSLMNLKKIWSRRQDLSQLSNQGRRRQAWTQEEDSLLKRGRTEMELTFKYIQKQLPGRSIEALKTRYAKIDGSFKRGGARQSSLEEMHRIIKLKNDRCWTWAEIASELGRSRASVVSFYHSYMGNGYTIAAAGSIQ
ncbi:hypothetical protein AC578_9059 [Pseudocercospora eumusae]|uniref:Myb-like domain-containing protein n=1 Tax=Pseudocercospora eumusae TaxID=321146 RepID=A0A139H8P0_9PEZI|nr:hypothetical protein AC578_9059 [Pseudocercospora eumusae]